MNGNRFTERSALPLLADEEAEMCVLGTLLTGQPAIQELAVDIGPELFFFPRSLTIFKAITDLHTRGIPIDVIALTQHLRNAGQLESVGGVPYVTQLATQYDKTVLIARSQISVLRDFSAKRRLRDLGTSVTAITAGTDLSQFLFNLETVIADARALMDERPKCQNFIEFRTPSELKSFQAPEDAILVGDCHIVHGATFVIAGPPGVGKSRASVALAVAGATGQDWFGLPVHRRFKTLIIQNENGRLRLSMEFRDLDCEGLDEWVRVSPPPPFGLCFDRAEFREAIAKIMEEFRPDVVIIDPWNAVARDEKARDYLETFNLIRGAISQGDNAPALGIVAHTRKPKSDEKTTGRGLLNLIAGSYVLGSVPRCVFVMQAASDNPEDPRVILTCCKNNDGQLGARSAWTRCNGLFTPVEDFNWSSLEAGQTSGKEPAITVADMRRLFSNGPITRAEAARRLKKETGAGRTSRYNALKPSGKFSEHLREESGTLRWED